MRPGAPGGPSTTRGSGLPGNAGQSVGRRCCKGGLLQHRLRRSETDRRAGGASGRGEPTLCPPRPCGALHGRFSCWKPPPWSPHRNWRPAPRCLWRPSYRRCSLRPSPRWSPCRPSNCSSSCCCRDSSPRRNPRPTPPPRPRATRCAGAPSSGTSSPVPPYRCRCAAAARRRTLRGRARPPRCVRFAAIGFSRSTVRHARGPVAREEQRQARVRTRAAGRGPGQGTAGSR